MSEIRVDDLRDGRCPFCSRGPFVVVAMHISKSHGISRQELRDMIGITQQVSIANPTHSKWFSERMAAQQASLSKAERSDLARLNRGFKKRRTAAALKSRKPPSPKTYTNECRVCGHLFEKIGLRKSTTCSRECRKSMIAAAVRNLRREKRESREAK